MKECRRALRKEKKTEENRDAQEEEETEKDAA
jgi:hypothetical protein